LFARQDLLRAWPLDASGLDVAGTLPAAPRLGEPQQPTVTESCHKTGLDRANPNAGRSGGRRHRAP